MWRNYSWETRLLAIATYQCYKDIIIKHLIGLYLIQTSLMSILCILGMIHDAKIFKEFKIRLVLGFDMVIFIYLS